jgi:hypothetical protein
MKTWHYRIPNDRPGEGWARVVLTSDGMFSAVSDWGHYAYLWTHPGVRDFREFFLNAESEWGYFAKKLRPEKILNEKASWDNLKRDLLERRRSKSLTKEKARDAWETMKLYSSWDEYLYSSACAEVFDEPWEFSVRELHPDVVSFAKRVLPRLAAMVSQELEHEAVKGACFSRKQKHISRVILSLGRMRPRLHPRLFCLVPK